MVTIENKIQKEVKKMKGAKKIKVYEKLHEQISELVQDVPNYFIELGESLYFMKESNLYELKFDNWGAYYRNIEAGNIDKRAVNNLIGIYEFFENYLNTEKGRLLMYVVGWTKLYHFVKNENKEKFQEPLDIGALNLDDLVMYAYLNSKNTLEENFDEKDPPELWRDIYLQTHICKGEDDVFKEGILQTLEATSQLYSSGSVSGIKTPPIIGKKMSEGNLSDQDLMKILAHTRAISQHYASIYTMLSKKTFSELTRPSILNELEDMGFYKSEHEFQEILNEQDLIREMLQKGFLNYEDLTELTDVNTSKIRNWEEAGYIKRVEENGNQNLFSLRAARKIQLIEDYIDSELSESSAAKKAERIIQEEENYRIRLPYKELSDRARELKNLIKEGQFLSSEGRQLKNLREKGLRKG